MKVFVSSTYIDLANYRSAAAEALERLGLELARMETFGARPQEPMEACLAEIEASELFVGIYAYRYGYIPTNSPVSITELEFDHAILNRRPTFCFFLDETFTLEKGSTENKDKQLLLSNFKAKIQKLVVRDTFTTPDVLASRLASSIGRYLLQDPRRNNTHNLIQFAILSLLDTVTMVFVDIMRLACVAGIDSARKANQTRYSEFVDMADSHLSDFRLQVNRLSQSTNFEVAKKCDEVDRSLSWAIVRLRRGPALDRSWHEFLKILYDIAEDIDTLNESANHSYYVASINEITSVTQISTQMVSTSKLRNSPDLFFECRLAIQQDVIDKMKKNNEFTISTIRDDINRRVAIPYFYIDLLLLRKVFNKSALS